MTGFRTATCRGRTCTAQIVWAVTEKGKPIPVDVDEHDDGNVELIPNPDPAMSPKAIVHGTPPLLAIGTFHMPHHATCPDAKDFRR